MTPMTTPTLGLNAESIPRSGIRDVFDRAEKVPGAISLCVGEPRHTASPAVARAACDSIRRGLTTYTDILGIPDFRHAAANYTSRVKGLEYDPDHEIQAMEGATMGIFLALKAVIDPGDEVIIPSPFFPSYQAAVLMCGGVPRTVALSPRNGMHLNAEDIDRAVGPRTKAVIINSPGNPTGAVTSAEELADVADVCIRHGLWAISDEVYHRFVFLPGVDSAPSIASARGMKNRTIIIDSLSKTFAMTGWRMGYLLAPAHVIEQTSKMAELVHSSVNSMAQYGGIAALNGPDEDVDRMRREYLDGRRIVVDGLAGCRSLRLIPSEGAFYAFVDVRPTGMSSEEFSRELLARYGVAVVPGEAFGAEGSGFVRLSYAGDPESLREGVRRLADFADERTQSIPTEGFDPRAMDATA